MADKILPDNIADLCNYGVRVLENGQPVADESTTVELPGSKCGLADKNGVAWFHLDSDEAVLTSMRIITATGQAGMSNVEIWPGVTDIEI